MRARVLDFKAHCRDLQKGRAMLPPEGSLQLRRNRWMPDPWVWDGFNTSILVRVSVALKRHHDHNSYKEKS